MQLLKHKEDAKKNKIMLTITLSNIPFVIGILVISAQERVVKQYFLLKQLDEIWPWNTRVTVLLMISKLKKLPQSVEVVVLLDITKYSCMSIIYLSEIRCTTECNTSSIMFVPLIFDML